MTASSPKSSSPKARSPSPTRLPEAARPADQAQAVIEVDEEAAEEDPTLGDDVESSTASLSSSILDYRTINGRTYHSERGNAAYW